LVDMAMVTEANLINVNRKWPVDWSLKTRTLLIILFVIGFVLPIFPVNVHASVCSSAGDTSLTASLIAHPDQMITGRVDASGCDVGIYVGPGVGGVVIANATVTGANDHAILVQDAENTLIEDSLITANGLAPHPICAFGTPSNSTHPCIANDYEVLLVGTSHALVKGNTVSFNPTDGGIAVADDGPANPGAPNPGTPHQSIANIIMSNLIENNIPGCGILVASYNSGQNAGALGNIVTGNLVLGSTPDVGLYNGQIVIAANAPNTVITGTIISDNVVDGSVLPGIAVHANAPADVISDTIIQNNLISNNGYYPPTFASPNTPTGSNGTVGISLVAEAYPGMSSPPTLTDTSIISNTVLNDKYGLWTCSTSGTTVTQLNGNATVPIIDCHTGPSSASASTESSMSSSVVPGSLANGVEIMVVVLLLLVIVLAIALMKMRRKKT
jgi:parallel beta helix pectate lyase-like protein